MPGSWSKLKQEASAHVRARIADGRRVLDVGPGMGTWADLIGHGRMDALEVFPRYIDEFGLREKYREVFIGDVRDLVSRSDQAPIGYMILGDVLEHLSVRDAQELVELWTGLGVELLVAVPYLCPQDPSWGNEAERHLQPDLTPENMAARYPWLSLLCGDGEYGYWTNYDTPQIPIGTAVQVLWRCGRGFWDHGLLMGALDGSLYPTPRPFRYVEHEGDKGAEEVGNRGCVVVVAGRHDKAEGAHAVVASRAWTLVTVVSDEEGAHPWKRWKHPTSEVIVQTPTPATMRDPQLRRAWPLGWPRDVRLEGVNLRMPSPERSFLWSFTGQVNNPKRQELIDVLKDQPDGVLHVTPGFAQGIPHSDYLRLLAQSEIAPSPSGSFTPDCFRTWEALEVGCLPVVDANSPVQAHPDGYLSSLLLEPPWALPVPSVQSWAELPAILARYREDKLGLKRAQNRAFGWWQRRKRQFVLDLEADVHAVSGLNPTPIGQTLRHMVTVLVTASPIPSHPSTEIVEECIGRIRDYSELADCEILLLLDGVRPEQEYRRADYEEHKRRLLWLTNWDPRYRGVLPVDSVDWLHQAGMTSKGLELVQTPYVLFVEADTWPVGEVPFRALVLAMERNPEVKVVRLHHETQIHPEHRHLLPDGMEVKEVEGVPLLKTRQWSQRPHLARTDLYRQLMREEFSPDDRTMIEDVMHGRAQTHPWGHTGLWFYAPPGDMKRSATCDGRGSDPKGAMRWGGRWR